MNASTTTRIDETAGGRKQQGFALILAILALLLLTFLGLTLSTTTSTELQIATNYRWSQQALYNAEAGLEAAKIILRNIPTDWSTVLPPARAVGSCCSTIPTPPATAAARNWENRTCDAAGNVGYGAVLTDTASGGLLLSQPANGPYENVTSFLGQALNGAFTVWIRRDLLTNTAGQSYDDTLNTNAVIVSEGTAPLPPSATSTIAQANRAVRVLQVKFSRGLGSRSACEAAEGQAGTTASGANFGACAPLSQGGGVSQALGGGGGTGADTGVK